MRLTCLFLTALLMSGCFSKTKIPDPLAPKPKPEFNARTLSFFAIAPTETRLASLPYDFDSLATGKIQLAAQSFTGMTAKNKTPFHFGEIGEPAGALGAKAYDHLRPHIGIHAKYKLRYCEDLILFHKLSLIEHDLRLPSAKTASMYWPPTSHVKEKAFQINEPEKVVVDPRRIFIAAEKLGSGESQWRILHFNGTEVTDTYVFRFNPATDTLRQILILKDFSFWMVDMPLKVASDTWIRDESKPLRIKANLKWLKSEFDVALQANRVLADWRELAPDGASILWSRVNMIGKWGTFSFRPESPAFMPREIALLDSNHTKFAADYNEAARVFIRTESNAALRAIAPPKPEPKQLGFTEWSKTLELANAMAIDPTQSRVVEPKSLAAMVAEPELSCAEPKLTLPTDFYSTTAEYRKIFGLPEPPPPPVATPTPIPVSDKPAGAPPSE